MCKRCKRHVPHQVWWTPSLPHWIHLTAYRLIRDNPSLPPGHPSAQRAIIIRQALQRAGPYPLSAISLALAELPKATQAAEEAGPGAGEADVRSAATEAVQKLSQQVGQPTLCTPLVAGGAV